MEGRKAGGKEGWRDGEGGRNGGKDGGREREGESDTGYLLKLKSKENHHY